MVKSYAGTSRKRATRTLFVAVVGALAFCVAGCNPASYVALGDSYTAGPRNDVQNQSPPGCYRSDHNFPHLVAPNLKLQAFRDVSCTGAQIQDMTSSQSLSEPPNPSPQFDALDSDTRAVTVTISGNDIGFAEIINNCISGVNSGTPCQDRYLVPGHDVLSDRINAVAPNLAAMLQSIHSRSPMAKVFVVGYLDVFPDNGVGCYSQMPFTDGDVVYLRDKFEQLDDMLERVAANNSSVFVDTYKPSIGHDACQASSVRWVEPLSPVPPTFPLHPNQAGMNVVTYIVLAAMHQNGL